MFLALLDDGVVVSVRQGEACRCHGLIFLWVGVMQNMAQGPWHDQSEPRGLRAGGQRCGELQPYLILGAQV